MDTLEVVREFFGWCSVINIGLLILTTILLILLRGFASRMHAKMFSLDQSDVLGTYFQYLGQYKIAIIVFNIVPYFALLIMD